MRLKRESGTATRHENWRRRFLTTDLSPTCAVPFLPAVLRTIGSEQCSRDIDRIGTSRYWRTVGVIQIEIVGAVGLADNYGRSRSTGINNIGQSGELPFNYARGLEGSFIKTLNDLTLILPGNTAIRGRRNTY